MIITPHSISEEKQIREMDAQELTEYASELQTLIDNETAPVGSRELLALAKIQYKQITGVPLTLKSIQRA